MAQEVAAHSRTCHEDRSAEPGSRLVQNPFWRGEKQGPKKEKSDVLGRPLTTTSTSQASRVKFSVFVDVRIVPRLQDDDNHITESIWYSQGELESMRRHAIRTARMIQRRNRLRRWSVCRQSVLLPNNDETQDSRGLEHLIWDPKRRKRSVRAVILAVLSEQLVQNFFFSNENKKEDRHEKLANVSSRKSLRFRKEAIVRASRDEIDAIACHCQEKVEFLSSGNQRTKVIGRAPRFEFGAQNGRFVGCNKRGRELGGTTVSSLDFLARTENEDESHESKSGASSEENEGSYGQGKGGSRSNKEEKVEGVKVAIIGILTRASKVEVTPAAA